MLSPFLNATSCRGVLMVSVFWHFEMSFKAASKHVIIWTEPLLQITYKNIGFIYSMVLLEDFYTLNSTFNHSRHKMLIVWKEIYSQCNCIDQAHFGSFLFIHKILCICLCSCIHLWKYLYNNSINCREKNFFWHMYFLVLFKEFYHIRREMKIRKFYSNAMSITYNRKKDSLELFAFYWAKDSATLNETFETDF